MVYEESFSLRTDISIRSAVGSPRSHKEHFTTVHQIPSTAEQPNACILESQMLFSFTVVVLLLVAYPFLDKRRVDYGIRRRLLRNQTGFVLKL